MCQHRELAFANVNLVLGVHICIHCVHEKYSNKPQIAIPVELLNGDIEPNTDPRLGTTQERISSANLAFPIIIAPLGDIIDGRHRALKARAENKKIINAIVLNADELVLCKY